jgi:hypothetical protein
MDIFNQRRTVNGSCCGPANFRSSSLHHSVSGPTFVSVKAFSASGRRKAYKMRFFGKNGICLDGEYAF